MRYLCLIYLDERQLAAMPEAELNALNARHLEFNDGLLDTGHFVEAEALQPGAESTCVRVRNGRASLTDGPYAETKEFMGGFYLLEAEDLDAAIALARHIPAAWRDGGKVEVRPLMPM